MVSAGFTACSHGTWAPLWVFSSIKQDKIARLVKKIDRKATEHQGVWLTLVYLDLNLIWGEEKACFFLPMLYDVITAILWTTLWRCWHTSVEGQLLPALWVTWPLWQPFSSATVAGSSRRLYENEWAWLGSNNTLCTKPGSGLYLDIRP